MKKSIRICLFLGFTSSVFFHSCGPAVKPFEWLTGTWEMRRSAGGTRLEIWSPYKEESIVGRGLIFNDRDTTMLEQIQLLRRDNDFYYIATVPDQNNGNPIEFKLVKTDGTTFTFENPRHDFPQRIIYRFKPIAEQSANDTPKDSLLVRVEDLDGKGIDYGFARNKK